MVAMFELRSSGQRSLLAVGIVFSVLPLTFVGLRLLCRRISNRAIHITDVLIIFGCVSGSFNDHV